MGFTQSYEHELLKYLMDNDRIDLPSEQESFEMTKRQKYLDMHKKNYAIYQGQGKDTA